MAAHDPIIPPGSGNIVSYQWGASRGSVFQFDSGWAYTYDADGDLQGATFNSAFARKPEAKAVAASTGVNPVETSYSLYGHIIPLSVFGIGRIGGEIIAGPWMMNGLATFCISFGVPADPYGNRILKEIAFDSEVVWENGSFNTEAFTYRFYPGRLDQAVDPQETSHYGADGIAYRPQMLLWFENLPIKNTKFQKIPYVAALISDTSGEDVNLGEAFERIAYSPWCNYTPADFESVGVTDGLVHGGMIIAQDAEFLALIQQFNRFYRNWNVLQTDKLRIVDRGAHVAPDVVLNRSTLISQVVFNRAETTSVPRVLELSTIDPEADYTITPSKAVRTLEPVNVSASVKTESAFLPIIMNSSTRISIVTYTKYLEEVARKKLSITAMITGFEIEPGDFISIAELGPDFADNTFKVTETSHGANYSVEITAEAFMNCGGSGDPHWAAVVLLLGFEDLDGSQAAPGFTDESPRRHGTASHAGGAIQIDTAQFKFGSSSLNVPGGATLPVMYFDNSPDWHLSSANSDQFTIEAWVRFSTITGPNNLIVGKYTFSTSYMWGFETVGTAGEFRFKSSLDGTTWNVDVISSGAALATNVWYHLAVDKNASGKIRLYKNGVMVSSATPADSSMHVDGAISTATALCVGGNAWDAGSMYGWIDELRITKGIARYASDGGFPVPTSAFPRGEVV